MTEHITNSPDTAPYSNEVIYSLYRSMVLQRAVDEAIIRCLHQGEVGGFFHSGAGQEAVAAGVCSALGQKDYILYDHRGANQIVAKGVPLDKVLGDFLGRTCGSTRGLGAGIVHVAFPDLGVLGQSGTLGGSFGIAVGAAMSMKIQHRQEVVVCFFGDGTAARETLHGALNWAGLWKLPVVFVLENNQYGISTHYTKAHSLKEFLADRAEGYAIPAFVVDGNDVLAVYDVIDSCVKQARNGEGPSFVEAQTFRVRGHFEGDPFNKYVDNAQIDTWKRRDPIALFRRRLENEARMNSARLDDIDRDVTSAVEKSLVAVRHSPQPSPERIFEGVFVDE